jgi:hypothetical protein
MSRPAYEFHYDPTRPSPYILEVVDKGDETLVWFGVPTDATRASMPFGEFVDMLNKHYPWAISVTETCPTCGR